MVIPRPPSPPPSEEELHSITVMLKDGTSAERVDEIIAEIKSWDNVENVEIRTSPVAIIGKVVVTNRGEFQDVIQKLHRIFEVDYAERAQRFYPMGPDSGSNRLPAGPDLDNNKDD